jgi:hypothetical protein
VNETSGDLQPLAHADGERAHVLVTPFVEPDPLQELGNELASRGAGNAVQLGVEVEVLRGGELEVGGDRLRDDSDPPPHRVGVGSEIVARDTRRSRGRREERGQHADEG